ncbi:MAG: hypothetical protein SGJ24_04500 [Chloroflexota bacterium]|nr:hypothetical protein [Chloroflexota bacterium]
MTSLLHADFAENYVLIDKMVISAATSEQNTDYVSIKDYLRIVVIVHALIVTTTLDIDIEAATSSAGANSYNVKRATQLVGADDNDVVIFDIRPDEMSNPAGGAADDGYQYLNIELIPSGAATVSVLMLGVPRNRGAVGTSWDQAVS